MKVEDDYIAENERKDQAFIDKLMAFLGSDNDMHTYFHTTPEEETCKSVMTTGFEYEDFYFTADQISHKLEIDIRWKLIMRIAYGKFTIVIQMAKHSRHLGYERFNNERIGANGEMVNVLPIQYIKGYFNRKTHEIVQNDKFDPYFTTLKKL